MARGRHVKRSGLLARLWPGRRRTPLEPAGPVPDAAVAWRLAALEGEVSRLRVLGIAHAAAAASADVRARRAEEQLGAARAELTGLRADLAALREELVWAFAERKLATESAPVPAPVPAPVVVDLRDSSARTA